MIFSLREISELDEVNHVCPDEGRGEVVCFVIDFPYHPPAPASPYPSWLRRGKFGIPHANWISGS